MKAVVAAAEIIRIGACGSRPMPEAHYLEMIEAQSRQVATVARALIHVADDIADSEGAGIPAPSPIDCLQGAPLGGGESR